MVMSRSFVVVAALCGAIAAVPGCGGSASSGSDATPVILASPTPVPSPPPVESEPLHTPTPPPCTQGLCEPPVTNTNPPVRLTIRVYKIQDLNGTPIDGIPASIPLGYKVTIDATPKDKDNRDTLGSGTVDFSFSDLNLVSVGSNHSFQKKLTVLAAGELSVQASLDGIDSNVLVITLGD
jgi:hypothetical protein